MRAILIQTREWYKGKFVKTFTISSPYPTFAAASMRFNVRSSFYVGDKLLNISEITVEPGAEIEGWNVEKLERELDLSVISLSNGGELLVHP